MIFTGKEHLLLFEITCADPKTGRRFLKKSYLFVFQRRKTNFFVFKEENELFVFKEENETDY
jgi:hypothetical protein